ncbi:hypothetical protein, partial [Mesorhizobium sp.]
VSAEPSRENNTQSPAAAKGEKADAVPAAATDDARPTQGTAATADRAPDAALVGGAGPAQHDHWYFNAGGDDVKGPERPPQIGPAEIAAG